MFLSPSVLFFKVAACFSGLSSAFGLGSEKIIGPAKIFARCGWSFWTNSVQIPKLPPPPLIPQKRSGLEVSLAVTTDPSAATMVALGYVSV
jgi:hypothetical protein